MTTDLQIANRYAETTLQKRMTTHCYDVATESWFGRSGHDAKVHVSFVDRAEAWEAVKRLRRDLAGTTARIVVLKQGAEVYEEWAKAHAG